MMNSITILRPDDMHVHLRDNEALAYTVPATAQQFSRAIVMPNLKTPVKTVSEAQGYKERITRHIPKGYYFSPLMTLYAHEELSSAEIMKAKESQIIFGVKLYPKGATTNSAAGVDNISALYPMIAAMEKADLPLLIHGEAVGDIDIFDREARFIEHSLRPLIKQFPNLRIVLEHITTADAVDFVLSQSKRVGATITAHHLRYNRNAMLAGGIKPHLYCMPILKREQHRVALLSAACSGDPHFFLGTDSAPHARHTKENDCGCAGVYSAPHAIEIYAQLFDEQQALDKLEGFASQYGAAFYQLPLNEGTITMKKMEHTVPKDYPYVDDRIVPMCAGETLTWEMVGG
jgi:dihydroorotase